jgi:hypothetical protein
MLEPYKTHGFADRAEYLDSLCEEYPRDVVFGLANMLGREEDFDGLVTALEDFAQDFYH